VADLSCRLPRLEAMLAEAQDPGKVDKLTKVERSLDETKAVLHKTIEAVLARGEKLDELVDKSEELSRTSKAFYKEARKTNSCCSVM
jgi:synaptobrevin homolog YKT6